LSRRLSLATPGRDSSGFSGTDFCRGWRFYLKYNNDDVLSTKTEEFIMENSKLLNEVNKAIRIKRLSKRTEEVYIKRMIENILWAN